MNDRNNLNGRRDNNSNNNGKKPGGSNQPIFTLLFLILGAMILMYATSGLFSTESANEITFTEFMEYVDDGKVESVIISDYTIEIYMKDEAYANPMLSMWSTS